MENLSSIVLGLCVAAITFAVFAFIMIFIRLAKYRKHNKKEEVQGVAYDAGYDAAYAIFMSFIVGSIGWFGGLTFESINTDSFIWSTIVPVPFALVAWFRFHEEKYDLIFHMIGISGCIGTSFVIFAHVVF